MEPVELMGKLCESSVRLFQVVAFYGFCDNHGLCAVFCLCFCLCVLEGYFPKLGVAFLVADGFSPEQINKFLLSITPSAFESLFNVHNCKLYQYNSFIQQKATGWFPRLYTGWYRTRGNDTK